MPNVLPLMCAPPCLLAQCARRELANDMKSLQVGTGASGSCMLGVAGSQ